MAQPLITEELGALSSIRNPILYQTWFEKKVLLQKEVLSGTRLCSNISTFQSKVL